MSNLFIICFWTNQPTRIRLILLSAVCKLAKGAWGLSGLNGVRGGGKIQMIS